MSRPSVYQRFQLIGMCGLLGTLASAIAPASVQAEVPLTRANVESLYNRVDFVPEGRRARPATLNDWLAVGDALRTQANARAELRFNDGSLARVGERATFWFVPNTRDFRLSNGTALFLIPPNRGPSSIQTPTAVTGIQGTALVVRHIPAPGCASAPMDCPGRTVVMVLTDSEKGPVEVTTDGGNTAPLTAGELAVIEGNSIQVLEFDLELFYNTSPLVEGLDLNNPNYEGGGDPTAPVREETQRGIEGQTGFKSSHILNPEVVSVDTQLGVTTSWLLPVDDVGNTFLPDGFLPNGLASLGSSASQASNSGYRPGSLMSSWRTGTTTLLEPTQASVPGGIIGPAPSGQSTAPPPATGNSTQRPQPPAGGGQPTTGSPRPPSSGGNPPPFNPIGTPVTPDNGGITNPGQPANPTQPFNPIGGTPVEPVNPVENLVNPVENPVNPVENPVNPVDTPVNPVDNPVNPVDNPVNPVTPPDNAFNPPGNNPTVDPGFTPVNPDPAGVPFQPTGETTTPLPFDPTGGVAPTTQEFAPAPTVNDVVAPINDVPTPVDANIVPTVDPNPVGNELAPTPTSDTPAGAIVAPTMETTDPALTEAEMTGEAGVVLQ